MNNNHLKQWRKQAGIKAMEAAAKFEVTPSMWSRWENGVRKLPADRVTDVSRVTGIPCHVLRPDVFEVSQ